MNISVDINLFATLIACIDHQATLDKQTPETQEEWRQIINTTHIEAKAALASALKNAGHGDARRTETGMGPMLSPGDTPFL